MLFDVMVQMRMYEIGPFRMSGNVMSATRRIPLFPPLTMIGPDDVRAALEAGFSASEVAYMFDLDAAELDRTPLAIRQAPAVNGKKAAS